jgi:hypothetical protein
LRIHEIKNRFKHMNTFSTQNLFDFYLEEEPALNEGTFRWRTYHLKKKGIIRSIKRGLYALENKAVFEPIVLTKLTRIFNLVKRQLPYTDVLIWDTQWLHDFMTHQPASSMVIVEVEKDAVHAVFELLREKRQDDVYIYSKKNDGDYYLSRDSIVVKPFLKESPTVKMDKVVIVPKIEKILVDLFFEENLLLTYQGHEMVNIFRNIFDRFTVNNTTLLRYARHRTVKERLKEFLINEVQLDEKYI